ILTSAYRQVPLTDATPSLVRRSTFFAWARASAGQTARAAATAAAARIVRMSFSRLPGWARPRAGSPRAGRGGWLAFVAPNRRSSYAARRGVTRGEGGRGPLTRPVGCVESAKTRRTLRLIPLGQAVGSDHELSGY